MDNHKTKIQQKSKLTLKCHKCGEKSTFHVVGALTCGKCGSVFTYKCLACDYEFQIGEEALFCSKCGWFICPRCGSCGCFIKIMLTVFKKIKEAVKMEERLKVYGLTSRKTINSCKKREKLIITHFFHSRILKRKVEKHKIRDFNG